jgi:hypothetical protein
MLGVAKTLLTTSFCSSERVPSGKTKDLLRLFFKIFNACPKVFAFFNPKIISLSLSGPGVFE